METSGRAGTEKLLIIVPAAVGLFVIVVITGGPTQFLRLLNQEIRQIFDFLRAWIG